MSRVIVVYILLFLIFLAIPCRVSAQLKYSTDSLSKEELKVLKRQIRKLKLPQKLGSFTLTTASQTSKLPSAGVLLNANEIGNSGPNLIDKFKVLNLSTLEQIGQYPFPSNAARKLSAVQIPDLLLEKLGVDFVIDLDTDASVKFWGLDSIGVELSATGYNNAEDYLAAVWAHDLVYLPENMWNETFVKNLKFSKEEKLLLDNKIKNVLIKRMRKKNTAIADSISTFDPHEWVKIVYLSNEQFGKVSPTALLNSGSFKVVCFDTGRFKSFNEMMGNFKTRSMVRANLNKDLSPPNYYIMPSGKLTITQLDSLKILASENQVVLLSFGLTQSQADEIKNVNEILIPDQNQMSQALAVEKIFDVYDNNGQVHRLGFTAPAEVGFNTRQLHFVDDIIAEAIHERAIPGCQLLIAKDGLIIWDKAYGYQTYDSLVAVTPETIYDLASLTKPLATTQAIMRLFEQNLIDLDLPLSTYLDYLKGSNKDSITTRQILSHQAGLYPYYPFWKKVMKDLDLKNAHGNVQVGKKMMVDTIVEDSIISWAINSELLAERVDTITHDQYMYSDIGFFFLKDLIEQKTMMTMDSFLYDQLYKPLPTGLRFNPSQFYPDSMISPTEQDDLLRNELVQGFVHDRNAALIGGVAGQAGLFGNAYDVAVMMQMQLNKGVFGGNRYFEEETIMEFTTRHFKNNRRGLGWDMPGPEPDGPISLLASDGSFGHTGFTGGSVWADPKENLIFVFLSNRIYPSVENSKLIELNIRTRIQDVVYESLIKE